MENKSLFEKKKKRHDLDRIMKSEFTDFSIIVSENDQSCIYEESIIFITFLYSLDLTGYRIGIETCVSIHDIDNNSIIIIIILLLPLLLLLL